jgi:hypothetical protein
LYRHFSAAGGTDQPVLSTARRQDMPDLATTAWHYVAGYDDIHCLSSADGTRLERHTAWLLL